MSLVEFFVEPLRYEFMVRALTTTLVTAVVCATLSCWLALIGWSLMGDAVSHAVLPDVVSRTSWARPSRWARSSSAFSPSD